MNKIRVIIMALVVVLAAAGFSSVHAQETAKQQPMEQQHVKLTAKQKAELANLTKDLMEKKKQLVSKYAEFGVIPKEKADKIIAHLDKRYAEMDKNGFIPQWKHHHEHHQHHQD
ncbi:YckD family protein [Heyndrickxia acidicola]|uniref:YckD family protein n=1 Tax=Heyndrickxia acidicola TaxID=209389 RepID=A0ABU6MCI6_9BACI|nr:YckD family protein [Heyndrickxia acidicola]MED1202376.1 YckD family protein [Heyndrickxia acidicola]